MKTIVICLMLFAGSFKAGELPGVKPNPTELPANAVWVKSDAGIWLASYNVWYKIDRKTSTLKCSYNKRRWKPAADAVWHDSRGKWYCIVENKMMSSENGKNWKEDINRSWQDINGIWHRLDSNFDLYEVSH